ncbi:response regulator [Alteromonas flava]|uniref:response regulator n=1 Tax=Alteromonas flava TaxID=2048003 RepID=UPI000C2937B0|nr:response regulator [Alteromonas flava]
MAAIRILLVEDDEDDYLLTQDYLRDVERLTFDVVWADSAASMRHFLHAEVFDLCLCDYLLGGETALDVLAYFQQRNIDLPVVVLSGQTDPSIDENVMLAGATDYLAKQEIGSNRFLRALRYALARKEVENARLQRTKIELENRAKDRFLAHLGHELRTPLTSILGYTDILLSEERGVAVKDELQVIKNNGKHLLSLLNDLLDMSKIIANKFELNPSKINFNGFLTDLYSLMRIAAHDKGLQLIFESSSKIPQEIEIDEVRLRQVLINLISNAIKYTDKGSIRLSIEFRDCNKREADAQLAFSVIDTGVGMVQSELANIFKPFEQIDDVIRAERGGAGLGLAICQEIVHRFGGDIVVHSEVEQGSTFTFMVPIHLPDGTSVTDFALKSSEQTLTQANYQNIEGHILVVDDMPEIRRLTGHLLQKMGAKVSFAENGVAALHALQNTQEADPIDAVMMDIHMPVMDGIEATREIRAAHDRRPVIALTAANHKSLADELLAQGFSAVVSKPIDANAMAQTLVEFLPSLPTTYSSALHILLLEDDEDAAALMSILLHSMGAQVDVAASISEAHQKLRQNQTYNACLIDRQLPDGDGLAFATELSKQRESILTVLISGYEISAEEKSTAGLHAALLKPVSKLDLAALLESFG